MTPKTSKKKWYFPIGILIVLIVLLTLRLYLNIWLLHYVNHSLRTVKNYQGSVQSIDVDLYRGAYRIHHLSLYKKNGNIPTPFINIDTADLGIQWGALLHGRLVSNVSLEKPVINFAVNQSANQTGLEEDWTKPIRNLMPVDINIVSFREGKLTYQDFSTTPKVDIYLNHMNGEVRNLRNVVNASQPLPSALNITGDSIGGGKLVIQGRLNILKQVPDMALALQLENVALPALNDYSNAYAYLDFKAGSLSVYSEFDVKDNVVSGYIKPLAKNISLVDLHKDKNPIKLAWETVASTLITIFTNHHTDQFATKVPLQGNLSHIDTDTWSAIGGIIRNAFIRAFQKGFDEDKDGLSPDGAGGTKSSP